MIAASIFGNGLLFVAFLLVVSGYLLKRSARRQTLKQEVAAPLSAADAAIKRLEACEARLNDYERSTNAAFQTRTALLQSLIAHSDDNCLILRSQETASSTGNLLPKVDRRSLAERLLRQAGYSDEQAEKLVDRLLFDEYDQSIDRRSAA